MYVMKISGYALSERTVTGPLIDDFAWSMSQVGLHSYVSGGFFNPLRFIQLLQNFAGDFYQVPRTPMRDGRRQHSSCSQKSFLFVSGGAGGSNTCLTSVERYEARTNSWTNMPPLSVGRMCHAMCAIGDSIMVFCGIQGDTSEISSIERLECAGKEARWQTIQLS